MAEAVVGLLVGKLGTALGQEAAAFGASLICNEASALKGLFSEIRGAKEELKGMQAYLQGAERFKDTDETTGIYVKKIRGFAFEIEDVVDEFTYKLGDRHGGFAAKMKKRIKHVKTWRRLALKLQDIKKRLREAAERKVRYEMKDVGSSGDQSKIVDQASYYAKDDNLVGIEENKKVLMQWLTGDSEEQSTVATVWGMGGVGKTTLVSHVYNLVKEDFDAAAWITVSNSYQVEALLKMIAKEFGVKDDVGGMGKRALTEVIHRHLQEDYAIKRRRTMRHWIAAGFIREKENKTLEEVAEGNLTELVNRSLLQAVERNHFGRLKCCRMHDVIHLLALKKANEECFGNVYDGSRTFSVGGTRRMSIQSENLEQLTQSGSTHLRALHVFETYINIDLLKPILTSSNLLVTLDLQGANINLLPNEVFNLFNLRYLGLRSTDIECLPEAIGRLQNLEVLDAFDAKLSYLPNNVVKLQKLRYLYACKQVGWLELNSFGGVKVPNGIRHLTALRALQLVEASSKILREVGALTELTTFGVCNVKSEHSADLSNAITKMSHLVHLDIFAASEEEELRLDGLCFPATLSNLGLQGQLEKISVPWSHLNNLIRLHLTFSNIDEESFSSLLGLHGLYSLELWHAFVGKKLHFCSGSFPKLRTLEIGGSHKLNQAEIEDGAMASLASLWFYDCPELNILPDGIEHLRALEELRLEDTGTELIEKLRQKGESHEDLMVKINHIRKVIVILTKKGMWERIR